jgi:hypothetical protein
LQPLLLRSREESIRAEMLHHYQRAAFGLVELLCQRVKGLAGRFA